MGWFGRLRGSPPQDSDSGGSEETGPVPVERAAPGIATLFEGLSEDGRHAVLDLGPAADTHLRLFSVFARQIRFADLLPRPPRGAAWDAALRALPPHPPQPYDVVLAWNLLDRLGPEERTSLIDRLDRLTASDARLYVVADSSREPTTRPLRFTLLDLDRISQQAVGPPEPVGPQLLPAQMERLMRPFEIVRAFTLRQGLREYVGVKGGARSGALF